MRTASECHFSSALATNKAGVIAGAVIGALLLLLLLLLLIWLLVCCCRKKRYVKEVANEIRYFVKLIHKHCTLHTEYIPMFPKQSVGTHLSWTNLYGSRLEQRSELKLCYTF